MAFMANSGLDITAQSLHELSREIVEKYQE